MAYVAPRTWAPGELVTAAMMNQDVKDNMIAVKALVDTIYTASFSEPARAWDTIYQNTSGKIRVVIITAGFVGGANDTYSFKIENATPPTTTIAISDHQGAANLNQVATYIVPKNWYYRTLAGNPASIVLVKWKEFDLF